MSYLKETPLDEKDCPPLDLIKTAYGFIPNFFRAQTMRPDLLEGPEPEQIAVDHTATKLPVVDKALLNFAVKLNSQPTKVTRRDIDALRTYSFSDEQILETVVMVGLAKFANFISFGLGTVPDFHSSKIALRRSETANH